MQKAVIVNLCMFLLPRRHFVWVVNFSFSSFSIELRVLVVKLVNEFVLFHFILFELSNFVEMFASRRPFQIPPPKLPERPHVPSRPYYN